MSSASMERSGDVSFALTVAGLSPETFQVVDFTGEEALNRDFAFRISLASRESRLRPEEILGREATFTVESRREGPIHRVPTHGVIGTCEVRHQIGPLTLFGVTLVPRLSWLSLSVFSEVYTLEKGIPGVLEEILKGAGFTAQDYQFRMGETYRERSFLCQFEESLHAFLDRWTEREGIVYTFDHEGGRDRILFYDQPHGKPSWSRSLVYRPPGDPDVGFADNTLFEWIDTARSLPSRAVVQDFNYRKAALEIREESAVAGGQDKTVVEAYGENLRTNAEASRQARLLAERLESGRRILEGKSTAVGLRAGTTVKISRHFREEMNGDVFVTRVRTEGSQPMASLASMAGGAGEGGGPARFQAAFAGISANVPFRPERRTPWPRISGVVQAIVEAEGSGKFAELNEYGEYKLRFPFALTKKKNQKGSGWVRLATPLAGSDNGMHFPLRKETEVLVAFLGGDPDQPVIVGALHNSESRNLISNRNPEKNMIRSAGGHFLMLNDGNL